ncbi:hypothetical protein C1H46_030619 [Malus baccata]|uniref:Mediator of RNA polymerase II transcription subunit 20 n=1 Tax=Malus baccata TaxID=106549 RepID=A0A540LBW6_MALBA|nr:hypothetical protein C1H46_030619 [Malus baccata]
MASRKEGGKPPSPSTNPSFERIILEVDSAIQAIMEKLQSYKSRVPLYFELPPSNWRSWKGFQFQVGDLQLRVGKVIPTHSENLRGIAMERRFIPKAAPRRVPKPEVKIEADHVTEESDAEKARELLKRFSERSIHTRPKDEKKLAPTQIAFGGAASTSVKVYGAQKGGSTSATGAAASGMKVEKEYGSPWNQYSYYPVTLPLRPPYSGDPEIRNQEEFGDGSEESTYDENSTKPANDLDLLEENKATSMFFLQLPQYLPTMKRSATADGPEATKSSRPPGSAHNMQKFCALSDLPPGHMGKMLVYRSGAIKLKLGDTLFDVSSGMKCGFAQDLVVTNENEKGFGIIGELNKRAIATPDIDSILESVDGLF